MKKQYKIFISYYTGEQELANLVKSTLNNAFKGNVLLFLASEKILPGENWKLVLQDALHEYDSILSIVTPAYIKRPMMFIEWTAFWLNNRTTYLLRTNDVRISDLPSPMQDSQSIDFFQEEEVKKLLEKLCKELKLIGVEFENIPFEYASTLSHKGAAVYNNILDKEISKSFEVYRDELHLLSPENEKIEEIYYYYYQKKEFEIAKNIFSKIENSNFINKILKKSLELNDYAFIKILLEEIPQIQSELAPFFRKLISQDNPNNELVDNLYEHCFASGVAMRKFGIILIDNNKYDSIFMTNLIHKFQRTAELAALGRYAIDKNLFEEDFFKKIINKFKIRQSTDLSNILRYAVEKKVYLNPNFNFIEITKVLASYAQLTTKKLFIYIIIAGDVEFVKKLLSLDILETKKANEIEKYISGEITLDESDQ